MAAFIRTQEIVRQMNGKVLGGGKIPHTCSFPVLRKVDGALTVAIFTQLYTREQMSKRLMQRPTYWACAAVSDGGDFREFHCRETEFCTAPYERLYSRGEAKRTGTREDVDSLYRQMDDIRQKYIATGIIDAFAYKKYLTELFEIVPSGQINFYRELSKPV